MAEQETKAPVSEKVSGIIEQVKELSVMELVELVKALEDEFGVSAAAPVAVAGALLPGVESAEVKEEKTSFDVILRSVGEKKIQVIKAVAKQADLGLREAKALVEEAPKAVKEGVSKEEAEKVKVALEEAGASVEIR